MSGSMRDQMPGCTAFVDALRAEFGREDIDNVIRRGLRPDCQPEQRVFFSEAGVTLGQQWVPEPGKTLSVAQMVLAKPKPDEKGAA